MALNQNILITGATGFIGSHLTELLALAKDSADGAVTVYGTMRSIKPHSMFWKLNQNDNVNGIQCDVRSYENLMEVITGCDIDQVYHLAAQPIVQIASKSPVSTYITNIIGSINVLEAARVIRDTTGKEIPVLIMSSDKAYGPSENLPYTEDHPLAPEGTDIYSSSKACEDITARAYAYNYDMPVVIARPVNTFGEMDQHSSRLIPTLLNALHDDTVKKLVLNEGSYHYQREFIYVKDTVSGLKALMDSISKTRGQAYNIGSGNVHTTEEVVNTFIELTGLDKPIEFKQRKKTFKEIERQYVDSTKMHAATGWKARYTLVHGLRHTVKNQRTWSYHIADEELCRQKR